jgi:hypothetical protein
MEVELAGPAGADLRWRPAVPGATPEATYRHRVAGDAALVLERPGR